MKILSVTEQVPQITSLPDGIYEGIWGGHNIDVKFNNKTYNLKPDEGVRGINVKVIVTFKDGLGSFQTISN